MTLAELPTARGAAADATPGAAARRRRLLGLAALLVALIGAAVASILVGSNMISPSLIWQGLWHPYTTDTVPADPLLNQAAIIAQTGRVPRTLLSLVVGMALGVAGALMQGHTRNPIADPGLLGVTQGAALAVVLAIYLVGITSPMQYVWFAFAGAAVASVVVFGLSSIGGAAASPLTLVLAGTGVAFFLSAMTSAVALSDERSLDALRFWNAGSVAGRGYDVLLATVPFIVIGLVLAVVNSPALNLLNLGDDVARGLGQNVDAARSIGILAITLLAGAGTAACGSIAFLGLVVPHVARFITGPDHRWLIPYSALSGALILMLADVVGRLVAWPGELEAGIVVSLVGAPCFVALVWWKRAVRL
ncbi:FecCD family ABC transporter permease [Gordonia hydrophobica]|uniref:Iron ABC transporter permease n=1 Tax=Gordonia hydrophobica TaxID=40516 RepID=A0ABZ2U640_9ACTN|nr:iron ABC transporter permease [Gordonia hydrophobica]MBM7365516.1 iron complex transport system permease protein [Gordonia hydrophobica]